MTPEPTHDEPSAAPTVLWVGVAFVLVGALAAAALLLGDLLRADPVPFHAGVVPADSPLYLRSTHRPRGVLHLAGSGSNLPLTRALGELCEAEHPDLHVVVFDSIGSTGGIQAAYDDVIDLGLISRPLREPELALGLYTAPYARVPVVFAVNLAVPDESLTLNDLLEIYAGRKTTWSDGSPIVVLQRERGDSSHAAVEARLPGFAAVNEAAYREARWRVVDSDAAMQEALSITVGAVGVFDLGAIVLQRLPVRPLRIDGFDPSEATVQSGRYPFSKDLAFVTLEQPAGPVAELLRCVDAPPARKLMRASGYIPLPEDQ